MCLFQGNADVPRPSVASVRLPIDGPRASAAKGSRTERTIPYAPKTCAFPATGKWILNTNLPLYSSDQNIVCILCELNMLKYNQKEVQAQ